ncbi:MAG: hypothetical protein ACXAC5_25365 [Promethearchaeota archaeon]|jgi:hypothetical protein
MKTPHEVFEAIVDPKKCPNILLPLEAISWIQRKKLPGNDLTSEANWLSSPER